MINFSLPAFRSKIYKLLSLCFHYPDEKLLAQIRTEINQDFVNNYGYLPYSEIFKKVYSTFFSFLKENVSIIALEDLQVEYTGLFITSLQDIFCPPYESIYRDEGRRLMGDSTITVKKFYNKFGLDVSQEFNDLPDHLEIELEFMSYLSLNEAKFGSEEKDELRKFCINYERKFLQEHILKWIDKFTSCIEKSSYSEFYYKILNFIMQFTKADLEFLSNINLSDIETEFINIESLDFGSSELTTLEKIEVETESDKWIYTTSPERYWHSPVKIKVEEGRALKIIAREDVPFYDGKQDVKSYACFHKIYAPDRLKFPLKRVGARGEGKFKRISWDEALGEISDKLGKYREQGHPEYVAFLRTHPPMEYMFNHFTHHYGSPNDLHTSTTSCYADGAIAQILTSGEYSDYPSDDFRYSKYSLFNGHNPLNALRIVSGPSEYAEAVRKGLKTIIVDPRLNEGSCIYGAEWVPIEPGKDAAFLLGIMNVIIREKLYDHDFLLDSTNAPILIKKNKIPLKDDNGNYLVWDTSVNKVMPLEEANQPALLGSYKVKINGHFYYCKTAFQLLTERVEEYPPKKVSRITTINAEKIEEIAKNLGKYKPETSIVVGTVSAQYSNSLQYQRAKQVLISLLGSIDKPGSKHYGPKGDSGIKLNPPETFRIPIIVHPMNKDRVDFDANVHPFIFTPLKNYPIGIAQNFLKAIDTGNPYPIKALFIIGSDVISSHNPLWKEAFKKVDFIVKSHVWPDDDCDYADIILPEAAYLERDDGFASITVYDTGKTEHAFTFLTVIQKVVEPLFETRIWHDYVKELAERMGFGEQYDFTLEEYWNYQLEPMGIDMDYLRKFGVYYPTPIKTRKIEYGKKKSWPTETGRINLYSSELAHLWNKRDRDPIYDPLPTYFPISVEPKRNNEFYFIQGKCPYFKCNFYRDNALLLERYLEGEMGNTRLWINSQRAANLGIKDGDWIWVESEATGLKEKIKAKVTEGIHPNAVFAYYSYGRRSKLMDKKVRSRMGINVQDFVPEHYVPYTGGQAHCEAIVKIYKT